MTEKEKMLAGLEYFAPDPELGRDRDLAKTLLARFNRTLPRQTRLRRKLLAKLFRVESFDGEILPNFWCDYGYNVVMGKHFFANHDCVFLDVAKIVFGDCVMLGPAVQVYTVNHPFDPARRNAYYELPAPVTVGNNVWIGGGAIILPGVTVGDNAVIGAGSVVTRDVPAGVLAAGNPCRVIRKL